MKFMIWVTGTLLVAASFGCTSVEQATEITATAAEIPDEGIPVPEWYTEETTVMTESGEVIAGYARAVSGTEDPAVENALVQAAANLRYWIDSRFEEVRQEVSESNQSVTDREFIMSLRNAVMDLDISDSEVTHDTYTDQQAVHAFVRIEITESVVMDYMEQAMEPWEETWLLISEANFFTD